MESHPDDPFGSGKACRYCSDDFNDRTVDTALDLYAREGPGNLVPVRGDHRLWIDLIRLFYRDAPAGDLSFCVEEKGVVRFLRNRMLRKAFVFDPMVRTSFDIAQDDGLDGFAPDGEKGVENVA